MSEIGPAVGELMAAIQAMLDGRWHDPRASTAAYTAAARVRGGCDPGVAAAALRERLPELGSGPLAGRGHPYSLGVSEG